MSILLSRSCIIHIHIDDLNNFENYVKSSYNIDMSFQKDTNHRFIERTEGIVVSL